MIDAQVPNPALAGEQAVGDHVPGGEASFTEGIISSSAGSKTLNTKLVQAGRPYARREESVASRSVLLT